MSLLSQTVSLAEMLAVKNVLGQDACQKNCLWPSLHVFPLPMVQEVFMRVQTSTIRISYRHIRHYVTASRAALPTLASTSSIRLSYAGDYGSCLCSSRLLSPSAVRNVSALPAGMPV